MEKVFRKNDDIVSRRITGEMFLIPVRGKLADMQRIFALDPVAEYIWQEIDGKKNLYEIRDSLLAAFEVDRDTADLDIREFVEDLRKADLISERD